MADQTITVPNIDIDWKAELHRPRMLALLFADWASETTDHKLAIGGVFDRIFLRPTEEVRRLGFYIYLRVTEAYQETTNILVYAPDGQVMAQLELGVDPNYIASQTEPNFVQLVSRIGLPLTQPGIHWFEVRYRNESLGRVPLIVQLMENQDENANEGEPRNPNDA